MALDGAALASLDVLADLDVLAGLDVLAALDLAALAALDLAALEVDVLDGLETLAIPIELPSIVTPVHGSASTRISPTCDEEFKTMYLPPCTVHGTSRILTSELQILIFEMRNAQLNRLEHK